MVNGTLFPRLKSAHIHAYKDEKAQFRTTLVAFWFSFKNLDAWTLGSTLYITKSSLVEH